MEKNENYFRTDKVTFTISLNIFLSALDLEATRKPEIVLN